ncbi:DHA2 family efflux MFS transporter permease subunit [Calidifontibacter sp. DB0510]|uniref:DHA2 family efflux MFS transporter permease subunit n=1 Tax=Metallococcus carri TaxID=1656884 RepID=A0A967B3R9_9MICO|nr:DHA2 family efflux MFS transporter permease subunit [Metallococcus carri]NHN55092.1 DHA2 family efflux MFS transporter permease subunit [Metallococcus carri]NOP36169.1 DHA2 family efflux MFS transporter permease subunit [Calidifontibacter sp. DB2511S]
MTQVAGRHRAAPKQDASPWRALFALLFGFFMILVDSTIVSVATPAIIADLHSDINGVVWVTSAYLLAYAVPLLVTGRLGDRFGPKRVYLLGLTIFTLASLWCGLTGSIGMLIAARVVQGLGAALLTPQTMAIITRIFPAERRGQAMGAWGATAGVATLVGPILGGVLVDNAGWEWIFFVNVPVGVLAFVLAARLVPTLPVHSHRFDLVGVALSAVGMFLLVFGIQEGQKYHWGTITGFVSVPLLIVLGLVVLVAFVAWQRRSPEPLVPLVLFADRNFSLANLAIGVVGFGITAMAFPIMLYAQVVRGWSPTRAALLLVPMAVVTVVLSPIVGRLVDRLHPRILAAFGLSCFAYALAWFGFVVGSDTPVWQLVLPVVLLGVANGFMWSPLSVTATRTLPPQRAGAGSGVYNTTRQVGAVLGSAAIATLMESRLAAHLGAAVGSMSEGASAGARRLPPQAAEAFSRAMGESLYLPAAVVVLAVVAVLFFRNPHAVKPAAGRP